MNRSRVVQVALGALIGATSLWASLRDIDSAALVTAVRQAPPVPVAIAVLSTLVAVALVTWRWMLMFGADRHGLRFWSVLRIVVIGQMLNIASPVRVGEVARLYGTTRATGIDSGRVLATLAVEKALEITTFGTVALLLIALVALPADVLSIRGAWIALPAAAIATLWMLARFGSRVMSRIARITRLPAAVQRRVVALSDSFAIGVKAVSSARAGVRLLGLSAAALAASSFANQILLIAFGFDVPIWAGLALLVVLQLGFVPPALPGRIGVFNYLTVVTLVWFGVDRASAAAFSIVLYGVAAIPKLVLGAVFMAGAAAPRRATTEARRPAPAVGRDSHLVSTIVPCLNEEKHLGGLLDALSTQQRVPDEVIVVEGGSTDGTLAVFHAATVRAPRLHPRLVPRHRASIPEAVNAGVAASHGDTVIRLDAHSSPSPNYVADAVSWLSEPSVGVIGGVWTVAPGADTATARAIARAVSHPLGAGDAAYRIAHHSDTPVDVDTVPFGCFRREVWTMLGGFDESLHANEDYEFNYRVRSAGLRVVLDPRMRSIYYARPTLTALARQYFRYGWWKGQMLRKHPLSLRWRQAAPAGFVSGLTALSLFGFVAPAAWMQLGVLAAAYGVTVAAAASHVCLKERDWARLVPLCAAFAIVHVCWGAGALVNVLTAARWPYVAGVAAPRESPTSAV